MELKWAALDDFDELLSFHVLKWHGVLREVSRESFTKFHTVSPSFNEGDKWLKLFIFGFVHFQSRMDPKLASKNKKENFSTESQLSV